MITEITKPKNLACSIATQLLCEFKASRGAVYFEYLPIQNAMAMSALGNTGDGIVMAQKVGQPCGTCGWSMVATASRYPACPWLFATITPAFETLSARCPG